MENPIPEMPICEFELGGEEGFISNTNITEETRDISQEFDLPLDCVWTIKVDLNKKIYLQFQDYQLAKPNDCTLNFIQVRHYVIIQTNEVLYSSD